MGISFLLAFAFPIIVFAYNYREILKDKLIQIICCFELAAWLEGALLYFKGKEVACDFVWASILSMFMVWLIAIILFRKNQFEARGKSRVYRLYEGFSYVVFGGHLFFGILNWISEVQGINITL